MRFALLAALSWLSTVRAANPTVTIDGGAVIGTSVAVPKATAHVNEFLGIPFAQSPPERFSPPQPAESWKQPLVAQAFKPACVQQFNCMRAPTLWYGIDRLTREQTRRHDATSPSRRSIVVIPKRARTVSISTSMHHPLPPLARAVPSFTGSMAAHYNSAPQVHLSTMARSSLHTRTSSSSP